MKEKHGKTLWDSLKDNKFDKDGTLTDKETGEKWTYQDDYTYKLSFDIDKHRRIARNYARKHYAVIEALLLWNKKPENEAFSRINTKG